MSPGRRAWGFEFEFASDDLALARAVASCYRDLPPSPSPASRLYAARRTMEGGRVVYDVSLGITGDGDGPAANCGEGWGRREVMTLLAWEVNGRARASRADSTVLHAAVLGGPAGAVAVCGETGSGKSTLAAAAAGRCWVHLSDDLALVERQPDGVHLVHPYARPLMLRAGGRALLGVGVGGDMLEHADFFGDEVFAAASDLGAQVATSATPVVAVVFLTGTDGDDVMPLSRADTLYRMTMHSATLRDRGASGFDDLTLLAEQVPGHTLGRSDPQEMLDRLAPLLGW